MLRIAAVSLAAGFLLAGCGTTETAEKDYNARVSEVVLAAAVDAERSYDYENAVRHFETLYERDKTNPNVIRDLARNLRYAGAPKQAIALLNRSMKEIGRKPDLVIELAKAQLAAAALADAHATLMTAKGADVLERNWQYHFIWGIYLDRSGDFLLAQESYRRALQLSPNNIAVLNNLALSYALAGDIDKGVDLLQKVVDDENATQLIRQNLALLHGIKGNMDAARTLAKRDLPSELADRNLQVYRGFHE